MSREELVQTLVDAYAASDEKVKNALVAGYALGAASQATQQPEEMNK